jgi:hypothetical protein
MIAPQDVTVATIDELEKEVKDRLDQDDSFFPAIVTADFVEMRDLLQSGKKEEAKRRFVETEVKVIKAEASQKAEPMAWRLFGIELAYLAGILLIGYLVHKIPDFWLWAGLVTLSAKTAWFGALGGIAVALYGLYSHVQVRDFDAKYHLWYLCKPVIGAIFGWFVYLVYYVGLVSVQGVTVDVKTPAVPYAIAFLAGFSERFTVQIIDKLMQVLATWQDKPATGPRTY